MNNSTAQLPDKFVPEAVTINLLISIIVILMILGVIGNALTLVVILRSRPLRSDIFITIIVSLCFSDLLSSSVTWLYLHRRIWGFRSFAPVPSTFCKIFWTVETTTNFTTALHIYFFASIRMIAIKYKNIFAKMSMARVKICIVALWSVSILVGGVPMWIWFGVRPKDDVVGNMAGWPSCTLNFKYLQMYTTYQYVGTIFFFYLPGLGIIVASSVIIFTVRKTFRQTIRRLKRHEVKLKQRNKERAAAKQLVLISASFFIGYVPTAAYSAWASSNKQQVPQVQFWFSFLSYIALRLSEVLNPIFYNLGSRKMKRRTDELLREIGCGCIASPAPSPSITSFSSRSGRQTRPLSDRDRS